MPMSNTRQMHREADNINTIIVLYYVCKYCVLRIQLNLANILPPFQNIDRFGFSKFIVFAMSWCIAKVMNLES